MVLRATLVVILALAATVRPVAAAGADDLHVPEDFETIQEAIDAAEDGDTVIVSAGFYSEHLDLEGKAITVRGAEGASQTVIDASAELTSVIRCASGEKTDTVIEGFTLTGGVGTLHGQGGRAGGAIYILNSSPTILDCVIAANDASLGGGIAIVRGSPTIRRCRFKNNFADKLGGAVYVVLLSYPMLSECVFQTNVAGSGGGVYAHLASPVIQRSTFSGNIAETGGGLMCGADSYPQLTCCRFDANAASALGGGIAGVEGSPVLTNCTIVINSAPAGGGVANLSGTPTITNTILWGNGPDDLLGAESAVVNFSLIPGGMIGDGNVDGAPLLVDPVGPDGLPGTGDEDMRLGAGSPAIDAGYGGVLPSDVLDEDGDGLYLEPIPFDLVGGERMLDDPDTPDSGPGSPPVVDIGAVEFDGPIIESCLGDLDGDGVVDSQDLMIVMLNMGPCDDSACPDLNGDGTVDTADLAIVFANWGLCG